MSVCTLCKSSKQDAIQYGEFLTKGDISLHTFCLYLTSNLVQNGPDHEGFFGFLQEDIRKEVKRTSKLYCCYCRKNYAGIGCCNVSCPRSFHLMCGIQNGALNQFCNSFLSFCHKHLPPTTTQPSPDELCCICYNELRKPGDNFNTVSVLLAPCCQNGWFHKLCLQKFAMMAGYFFKCPLCNDTKVFREQLPFSGIYIPHKDAAWELEPNAFSDLLERPTQCSARKCGHKPGRSKQTKANPLIFCETCGSQAIHKNCWLRDKQTYNCSECYQTLERLQLNKTKDEPKEDSFVENDQSIIDVCDISDNEEEAEEIVRPTSQRTATRLISYSSEEDNTTQQQINDEEEKEISSLTVQEQIYYRNFNPHTRFPFKKVTKDYERFKYREESNRRSIIEIHISNEKQPTKKLTNTTTTTNEIKTIEITKRQQEPNNLEQPSTSRGFSKLKNTHWNLGESTSSADDDDDSDFDKPLSNLQMLPTLNCCNKQKATNAKNNKKNISEQSSNKSFIAQRTRRQSGLYTTTSVTINNNNNITTTTTNKLQKNTDSKDQIRETKNESGTRYRRDEKPSSSDKNQTKEALTYTNYTKERKSRTFRISSAEYMNSIESNPRDTGPTSKSSNGKENSRNSNKERKPSHLTSSSIKVSADKDTSRDSLIDVTSSSTTGISTGGDTSRDSTKDIIRVSSTAKQRQKRLWLTSSSSSSSLSSSVEESVINMSYIAMRTRRKTRLYSSEESELVTRSKNEMKETTRKRPRRKTLLIADEDDDDDDDDENISLFTYREKYSTRKIPFTTASENGENENDYKRNELKKNSITKQQQQQQQISTIKNFKKYQESKTKQQTSTLHGDEEDLSKMQPSTSLNSSCIANRTRRSKSMMLDGREKVQLLKVINGNDDESQTSSSSTTSSGCFSSAATTTLYNKRDIRKRKNYNIHSRIENKKIKSTTPTTMCAAIYPQQRDSNSKLWSTQKEKAIKRI